MTYYRDDTRTREMTYYYAVARVERAKAYRLVFGGLSRMLRRLLSRKKGRAEQ